MGDRLTDRSEIFPKGRDFAASAGFIIHAAMRPSPTVGQGKTSQNLPEAEGTRLGMMGKVEILLRSTEDSTEQGALTILDPQGSRPQEEYFRIQ